MHHPTPRLFDADPYTIVSNTAVEIRERYLLPYPKNTRHAYESDLKMWFRWCADRGLNPIDAQRWHIELYDQDVDSSGLKPSTRQRKLTAICGFYRYAEQEGYLEQSPGRYVRKPKVPNVSTSNWLERFEIGPFLMAAADKSPRHGALCSLLCLNGLRVSEAVGASISDLSFNGAHRTLRIVRKGGKETEVPLAPRTFRAVLLAVGERTEGPLLLDARGNRMSRDAASRAVRLAAKKAGITKRSARIPVATVL